MTDLIATLDRSQKHNSASNVRESNVAQRLEAIATSNIFLKPPRKCIDTASHLTDRDVFETLGEIFCEAWYSRIDSFGRRVRYII